MARYQIIKRALLIFLPLVILTTGLTAGFYYSDVRYNEDLLKAEIRSDMRHMLDISQSEFDLVISDLLVISEYYELKQLVENPSDHWKETLAYEYLSYATKKGLYDQIRYLDETGQEIVRINYNNGDPAVVPEDELQNKASRYYFADTFNLNQGEIFVSPLDLNIEYGQIEEPLKPMIRFGTPIFNAAGEKKGIVLINYLADNLLQKLNVTLGGREPVQLINSAGYWLQAPNPDDTWGFMYLDKQNLTFGDRYPETWQRIKVSDSGQFVDENGLFTFATIYPLIEGQMSSTGAGSAFEPSLAPREAKEYYWKLVYAMTPDEFAAATNVNKGRYWIIYSIILVALAALAWILSSLVQRRLQLETTLRQKNRELEDANQAKSRFVASMSHELRTPLNAIIGLSNIMLEGAVGEISNEVRDCTQDINSSGQRLLLLINDILDMSKIEAGKIDITVVDLEIKGIIDNSVRTVKPLIEKKQHQLTVKVAEDIPTLRGDPARLEQVLINLLSNAIKFTPSGGKLGIDCRMEEDWCQVSVSDNGIGVKDEDQDKLFQAFVQAGTLAENDVKGTGLGLALSKQFMEQMGGMIWLESVYQQGSTFHIALPAKENQTEAA